ncbi:GDSL-type esterase/lipase family protein [Clostridium celatum]|uniref:GDSL-like protein n=1 Tax=Clostridium celatum DSM 1785 TaxID=545697 RepID=L1QI18_9CLOT|nr:GDSL-type esterase/lipase family protein [Clostridium celatum]EKY27623.1 GDSL-like protein [Clostridium celatum DSM 1785]MCE9655589.1 GDSL-type esterase/lipase family protein [Clostridium celatum]MDU2266018.1 GDSL-type esterase/lipase family protein [Clostridium celatum]MDU3721905.1 GDSL-type esterase/lipase family protein [Clostridium celatum]MDU6297032.1 GDSL-type esterase/lipase family protein [Clostridium celatum]
MNDTYVFLGDSLTFGYGVKPKENWVNKLKQKYNLCIYNKGVNGSTTTDMLFRFQEDVLDLNPNKLFIMGGTNDLLSNRSIDSIISNIELMIKDSLCNNISVIIGIPPTIIPEVANELFMKCDTYEYCKKNLSQLRINLIALCTKYSLPYLDFYSAILSSKNKLEIYSDGIHFSPKGQDILFKESENLILM